MISENMEQGARILIVEDEVLIAADLESRLKALGYTICGKVTTGPRALESTEEHRPDLVMMDIVLKGEMDGIEAARIIRDKWGIPIVFLSAYADTDRLQRAGLTYPFGYLIKPFHDRDLLINVQMALYVAKVDAERRKVEIELKLKSDALENSLNGFDIIDENGRFVYANRAYLDMWGYDFLDEIMDTSPVSYCADPSVPQKVLKTLKEKGEITMEFTARRKDGSFFEVLMDARLAHDEFGREIYVGTSIDITERTMMLAALRQSEKRLIAAQRLARMGDFTWEVESGQVTWSEGLFDLLKYDKTDEIDYARVNAKIHHPDDLARVTEWLNDCVQSGRTELTPNEYRILRQDGEIINVRTVGVIERTQGKTTVFATVQDITERRLADGTIGKIETLSKADGRERG